MHTTPAGARRPLWLLGALGALGSTGTVLAGATIGANPRPHDYRWLLWTPGGGYALAHVLFYAAVGLLTLAWWSVGAHARAGHLSVARAWALFAAWATPLFLGAPVFSRDVYSYVAGGELAHRGLNPYVVAPHVLGGPLVASIAMVWRHTTSPYGPLFVVASRATASLAGHSLIVQVLCFRALELIGVGLLMVALPALARGLGVEPGQALWLGVLSPLALFSAVSSAHNDTLMIGLLVLGLVLARRGARRAALVVIALAATVKLPALAGAVFIVGPAWRAASGRARAWLAVESAVLCGVVVAGVTLLNADGWTWLGSHALSIPTQLHVLTTPVVSVGALLASGLHALGDHVATRDVVTWSQHVGEVLALGGIVVLVLRTRADNAVRSLGVALLLLVLASPTLWPWYLLWGLTVLAATSAQRSAFLALCAGAAMLLVGPGGTPMIGGNGVYVSGPLVLAALAWFIWSGTWRTVVNGVDRGH